MRKTIATLLVFLIFLVSCASPALQPTETQPTRTATLTAIPTLALTETPTSTPTPEATQTPEPTEIPMDISFDPENPLKITLEDLTSGRLAESERKVCEPFSDDIRKPVWVLSIDEKFSSISIPNRTGETIILEQRSQKICSFSEFTSNLGVGEKRYILIGIQVRNSDGTDAFLHLLRQPKQMKQFFEFWQKSSVAIMIKFKHSYISRFPDEITVLETYDDWSLLGDQLTETNIVPKELEQRPIVYNGVPW